MVKAMYSGVAGLKAHQSKMDVIGNNIANVNTWGYKSMDTSFKESIYALVNSASAGSTADGGYGGTNPSVVGYGSMVSAITANFTSGNQVPTGKNLDLYIDGTAFFAVGPMFGEGEAKAPGDVFLSRVGDFSVVNGYLVDSNGRYVYGSTMSKASQDYVPGPISVPDVKEKQPIPLPDSKYKKTADGTLTVYGDTTPTADSAKMLEYKYKGPGTTVANFKTDTTFLDKIFGAGNHPVPIPPATTISDKVLEAGINAYNKVKASDAAGNKLYAVIKNDKGEITEVKEFVFDSVGTAAVDRPIPETTVEKDPETGIVVTTTYEKGDAPGEMTITTITVTPVDEDAERKGGQFDDGRFVFNKETGGYKMLDSVSTLKPIKIPTTGTYYDNAGVAHTEEDITYTSFTVQNDGMIYGTSNTNKTYLVGCVGLVNVSNPSGMEKADGPYYKMNNSSGEGKIVQPGGVTGKLTSGYLESANVDIATEFSSMITTQRGFQANSKIITVTDEMLQELVNMKR